MSQISNLSSTILNIKTDIKNAIINKGQNVNDLFSSYPNAIMNISGGSAQGIKIFDSIANMQSDINSQIGDLAIVYHSTIDSITENTQFQEGTFPETVVLSTAVSDYIRLQFKAVDESVMFDCWGEINSERFNMSCYIEGDGDWIEYRIEYTSSDGLTYTRTRFQINQEDISGNIMDFGIVIAFGSRREELTWDDRIGSFIKAGTVSFEGMYKHNGTNYNWANTGLNALSGSVYKGKFYGNNIITNGIGNVVTDLNIDQLKDKINLYNDLSYLYLSNNTQDLSYLFQGYNNITKIPNIDTSNVTNVSYMFQGCNNLTAIPNFNTSNVTNMWCMFSGCCNLTNIPNFDTTNVTGMWGMFSSCQNLINVPNFNASNVTTTESMFIGCQNLITIPNFDTTNVTGMGSMFQGCYNLTTIPNFNTSNVKSMYSMFYYCQNLTTVPNFDTSNVTSMSSMFSNCRNLTSVPNFDTSNVISMYGMFWNCSNLINTPNLNFSKTSNIMYMFCDCYNLKNVLGDFTFNNLSYVTLYNAFINCRNLSDMPIFNFNNCTDINLNQSFRYCHNLVNMSEFNMSNVTDTAYMFVDCYNLVNVPLFNSDSMRYMSYMFTNCNNLSSESYANIVNSLPPASQLSNQHVASIGLNINKFTEEQKEILGNKGYFEFLPNWYTVIYS